MAVKISSPLGIALFWPKTRPTTTGQAMQVTADNFTRAETDMYFDMFAKRGAFGKFYHYCELPLEKTGVRPNRDTLYSQLVFDLDAGPVTITLPDAGKRFMSLMVIDEDHYVTEVVYFAGSYTYDKKKVGRCAGRRILVGHRLRCHRPFPEERV